MAQIKKIEIPCYYCGEYFNSPIFFADTALFETASIRSMEARCSVCKTLVVIKKEEMRITLVDGSVYKK